MSGTHPCSLRAGFCSTAWEMPPYTHAAPAPFTAHFQSAGPLTLFPPSPQPEERLGRLAPDGALVLRVQEGQLFFPKALAEEIQQGGLCRLWLPRLCVYLERD